MKLNKSLCHVEGISKTNHAANSAFSSCCKFRLIRHNWPVKVRQNLRKSLVQNIKIQREEVKKIIYHYCRSNHNIKEFSYDFNDV